MNKDIVAYQESSLVPGAPGRAIPRLPIASLALFTPNLACPEGPASRPSLGAFKASHVLYVVPNNRRIALGLWHSPQ